MTKQKSIIVYQSHISNFGGVTTFLYNWCLSLRNYYDITIVYGYSEPLILDRLKRLVKMIQWKRQNAYIADIVLRNSVWGEVPVNIESRDNRYLEMRHANYKYLQDKDLLKIQYHPWDKTNEVIGCGEFVSKMSNEVLHDNPLTIQNILAPKKKTNKILHLISCTRLDKAKGWGRMKKMMDMMKNANIKFEWNIFTPDKQKCDIEEVHFYSPRYDIFDYLADADYTVLLSDSEGLPYTVQESLQYKVPCIVTDVGGCTELIEDSVNGYVVPLDMNFDITRILKKPKLSTYDNHALDKWLEYLGDEVYVEKEDYPQVNDENNVEQIGERTFLVSATKMYAKLNIKDTQLNHIPQYGEQFIVSESRMKLLNGDNPEKVKFINVIKEIY